MLSLHDLLPPEAQHLLGLISFAAIAVGFILWFSGIKIARFSVAISLGLLGASAGAWQLPHDLPISPITGALLGFVVGALIGALAFKLLQGIVLAACIGLVVAGVLYQWNSTVPQTSPVAAPSAHTSAVSDLKIPLDRFSVQSPPVAPQSALAEFKSKLIAHWNFLSPTDRRRLLITSICSAITAFLLALAFQRPTTWIVTASLGALIILVGLNAAVQIYAPQYQHFLPASSLSFYLTLGLITSLGLLLQYHFFWPARTKPLPHLENPLYRGPRSAPAT